MAASTSQIVAEGDGKESDDRKKSSNGNDDKVAKVVASKPAKPVAKLKNGTSSTNKPKITVATADTEEDEDEDEEGFAEEEEEEEDEIEEEPKAKATAVKATNPRRGAKKQVELKQESEDEEDGSEESVDEEEEVVQKKTKAVPAKAQNQRGPKKPVVSKKEESEDEEGSEDEDLEEEKPVSKKAKITTSLKIESISEKIPVTSKPDVKNEQNEVDMDQCRVCKSKTDLINVFTLEDDLPISDLIMNVTNVKILERDYLPKLVCKPCLAKIKVAVELKSVCEATDTELRSKLKRSKKIGRVGRRRGDFILVDCELSSGDSDHEAKDDDEFHLSEVSESDVSFTASGKKKKRGRRRKSAPRKKASPKTPLIDKRKSRRQGDENDDNEFGHEEVFVDEAPAMTDSSDDNEPISKKVKVTPARRGRPPKSPAAKAAAAAKLAEAQASSKIPHKKRSFKQDSDDDYVSSATKTRKEHQCPFCDELFHTAGLLKEHKKKYIGLKPLTCDICQKAFKQRVSYETHIKRHQEDETRICKLCSQAFGSRMELRRHEQSVHDLTFECEKCKRPFTSRVRLERHIESKCPGFETHTPTSKRKSDADGSAPMGKDLFKCVAPLTTTYWSDSFSD